VYNLEDFLGKDEVTGAYRFVEMDNE